MKSKVIAYGLWLISGCGCLGLHRAYLQKYFTGVLWFFSGGLGFVGSVYDGFTLGKQVDEYNRARGFIEDDRPRPNYTINVNVDPAYAAPLAREESLESKTLRLAKKGAGYLSPAELAEAANCGLAEAEAELDRMVSKGVAEFAVRPSGLVLYKFPAFAANADAGDYTV